MAHCRSNGYASRVASPFAALPTAVRELVGELDAGWVDEPRVDCDACPMVAAHDAGIAYPFSTGPDVRCCTAQPNLASFLVGRALAEPASAALIARRIANRDGVSAWGIRAVTGYDELFTARALKGFGKDLELRCPFWVGGQHSCGIWAARSARCRGFFCRHERGLAGAQSWSQATGLAVAVESALAEHLAATLPDAPDATADDAQLLAWFARCAAAADALDRDAAVAVIARVPPVVAAAELAGAAAAARLAGSQRGQLIVRLRAHRPPIARVLVPAVSATQRAGGDVLIAGYSTFDWVRAPVAVFALLAGLDGTTPWRDALTAARTATSEPRLDDALVRELHRVGALRDPAGSDEIPEPPSLTTASRAGGTATAAARRRG
jgi:hypothetical protein